MIQWITDRLKERSTWLGLVGLASAAGLAFDAAKVEAIVAAGVAIAAAIAVFTADPPPAA